MDIGADAFVARRPEVPALLAELGLAGRQITTTGVRPTIFSPGRIHPLPPDTVNGIPNSVASVTAGSTTRRSHRWPPNRTAGAVATRCRPRSRRRGGRPVRRTGRGPLGRSDAVRGLTPDSAATIASGRRPPPSRRPSTRARKAHRGRQAALPGGSRGPVFGAIEAAISAAGCRSSSAAAAVVPGRVHPDHRRRRGLVGYATTRAPTGTPTPSSSPSRAPAARTHR